jgi:hypothetical protein
MWLARDDHIADIRTAYLLSRWIECISNGKVMIIYPLHRASVHVVIVIPEILRKR